MNGTTLPQAVPEGVLDCYPQLRRRSTCQRLDHGSRSSAWLVQDTTTDERFALRSLPPHLPAHRVQLSATAHQHAASAELAPAVIPTRDGHLLACVGGGTFMLTEYATGKARPYEIPNVTLCHDLGHTLGRLHERLRTCPRKEDAPRFTLVSSDPTKPIRAALTRHGPPACPHQDSREVLTAKLRRAQAIPADLLMRCQSLPQTLIHGDIHLPNILLNGPRVTAVVDFDLARQSPASYELLRSLLYCVKPTGTPSVFGRRVRAFLSGYFTAASLTEQEIDTMVDFYRTVQLLDTHGLDTCAEATDGLLQFGQARFALLYWLDRYGQLILRLARESAGQHGAVMPTGTRPVR